MTAAGAGNETTHLIRFQVRDVLQVQDRAAMNTREPITGQAVLQILQRQGREKRTFTGVHSDQFTVKLGVRDLRRIQKDNALAGGKGQPLQWRGARF